MGYKLAGFNVLGGVEIDPRMQKIYKENHNPKYLFKMSIKDFNKKKDFAKELKQLHVLDGSPPCSSFSMVGLREKTWGKKKHFREGQAKQKLDSLFFDFIETAKILQPKVVIAENVTGIVKGDARFYVKQIINGLNEIGYFCQIYKLNAALMGVPQKRERIFFIANRLNKSITLNFNEKPITPGEAFVGLNESRDLLGSNTKSYKLWYRCAKGSNFSTVSEKGKSGYSLVKLHPNKLVPTLTTKGQLFHYKEPRELTAKEYFRLQTFPDDFKTASDNQAHYVCGMSVPPFMMQRIATEVYKQFFM